MNILFLTNLLPYPLDNGGKIKTYTTLKSLKDAGHHIDLLCFKENLNHTDDEENDLLEICENIQQVYQRLTTAENKMYMVQLAVRSLFSKFGVTTYKFVSKKMMQCILLQKEKKYNIIYIDHCQFEKLDGQPVIRIIRINRLCVKLGNTSIPTAIKVKYMQIKG